MRYIVVIPARLESTRLPGKPLVEIAGKSMIQRTYERCLQAVEDPSLVMVATNHVSIVEHITSLGYNAIITSNDCLTGTDRVAEVATKIDADYYINVQGDEPLINPDDIKKVIESLDRNDGAILNGYAAISSEDEYRSLSIPKLVFSENGKLLYMSRAPIPGNKLGSFKGAYRQICIYAFPKSSLAQFAHRSKKTKFEEIEDIEILRFLEMGVDVQMLEMSTKSIAVDTQEDLEKVRLMIKAINE